jgi:hypothetical protein
MTESIHDVSDADKIAIIERAYRIKVQTTDDLAQIAREAIARAEEAEARNKLFSACLRRAQLRWKEAHPESNVWPDGTKNIVWLLKRLEEMERSLRAIAFNENAPSHGQVDTIWYAEFAEITARNALDSIAGMETVSTMRMIK